MIIKLFSPPMHPSLERDVMKLVPAFGIYVLAGVLRDYGYEVEVYDHQILLGAYEEAWDEALIKDIVADADIVGLSSNSFSWGVCRELIEVIKSEEHSPYVVCGGIHPTFFDIYVLETTKADAVILGEGEKVFIELVEAIEKKTDKRAIHNFTFKENGNIIKNPFKEYSKFFDYGLPAYDMIPEDMYFNVPVETSRGCMFHCEFCSILDSHNWRGLDAETSIKRIEDASKLTGKVSMFDSVYLVDNCFTADVERATKILQAVTYNDANYSLHFEARCTDLLKKNQEFLESMNPSRISTIQIGVESGYNEGLVTIKKGLTTNMIIECLENLQKKDLAKKTLLSFIIGFPWERREHCVQTIEFAKYLEERFGAVIGLNWWLPLKSSMTDNVQKYGVNIAPSVYDNPLWENDFEFLKTTYKSLSISDIDYIGNKYNKYITNLVDML